MSQVIKKQPLRGVQFHTQLASVYCGGCRSHHRHTVYKTVLTASPTLLLQVTFHCGPYDYHLAASLFFIIGSKKFQSCSASQYN